LKEHGVDGFVFGILDKFGNVDEHACQQLIKIADPYPCTFHRAFDQVVDPLKALETIVNLGFSRILTSGQEESALEGAALLRELVYQSDGYITIIGGGGVTPQNVERLILSTGLREVHGSAKKLQKCLMQKKKVNTGKTDDSYIYVSDREIVANLVKNAENCFVRATESSNLLLK